VYLATLAVDKQAVAKPAIAEPAIAEPAITEPVVADLEKQKKSERPLGCHIIDPSFVRNKSVGLKYKIGDPRCADFLVKMNPTDRNDFIDTLESPKYKRAWEEEYNKLKNLLDVEKQAIKNPGSKLAVPKLAGSKRKSSFSSDMLMFNTLAKTVKMRHKSCKRSEGGKGGKGGK